MDPCDIGGGLQEGLVSRWWSPQYIKMPCDFSDGDDLDGADVEKIHPTFMYEFM